MRQSAWQKPALSIALLISVALAAGCVGQIPGLPGFGSDVIKPSVTSTTTGVADVIAIEGVQTIPTSPILPDQSLRLFMNIVSHDIEPLRPIRDIAIQLYDASVFKNQAGQLCNQAGCYPEENKCVSPTCTLQAGETKAIIFNVKAPSVQEIANIITRGTLNWLLRYSYTSTTNYDILLVSEQEITRLQQLGQTLAVPLQNIQSAGPIKIDVSMASAFGIVSRTSASPDIFVIFKLRNVGSGFPPGSNITAGNMRITIPSAMGNVEITDDSQFQPSGQDLAGNMIYTNKNAIDLFKKESIPLQLRIKPNQGSLPVDVPHRTFTISANVSYTYELRGSTTLEIRPPQLAG